MIHLLERKVKKIKGSQNDHLGEHLGHPGSSRLVRGEQRLAAPEHRDSLEIVGSLHRLPHLRVRNYTPGPALRIQKFQL